MGFIEDLLIGMAVHLDAAGVGTWRGDGSAYTSGEIGITIRGIPQTPDRLIVLAPYVVDSGAYRGLADHDEAIQARIRGTTDPRVCQEIADDVFAALDSAHDLTWQGIAVVQVWRQSYTSLGDDTNGRYEASHNYYLNLMRPTTYRTD